jgi:hypothetical protein
MVLGFIIAWGVAEKGNERWFALAMVFLFLFPFIIFTNLYIVHNYYPYASAFWLILALAVLFTKWSRQVPVVAAVGMALLIVGAELITFYRVYFPSVTMSFEGDPRIAVSNEVMLRTAPDSVIMIFGDDWSPEIAFLSKRHAIYLPDLIASHPGDVLGKTLADPLLFCGSRPLGGVIVNRAKYQDLPVEYRSKVDAFLQKVSKQVPSERVGEYECFFYSNTRHFLN